MDDQTLKYMRARVEEAERLGRAIADLARRKADALDRDAAICGFGSSSNYFRVCAITDDMRTLIAKQFDSQIAALREQLAAL